ncbi:MAG: hypothetical protein GEU88_01185 [Solirubrobacterales bacterium]|nr:hypothetical protein [Solirubrobacterales bacterium]
MALLLVVLGAGAALGGSSSASGRGSIEAEALPVDPLAGPRAMRAIDVARDRLGGRFAGAWIDRSGDRPRLTVATSGSAPAAAERLDGAGAIDVVSAAASSSQLARARRAAVDLLDRSASHFAVGVDPAAGVVEVRAAGLDRSSREAIERRLGEVAVSFDGGRFEFRHMATCPACFPPFRGGLAVRIGRAGCTSGFTMKRTRRRFVGVTAGHCRPGGERRVFIGGRKVGRVDKNSYRGDRRVEVDALRFPVPRSAKRPRVYIPAFGIDLPVRGRLRERDMVPGTAMCFVGVSSGGACSVVTRTNLTIKAGRKIQSGLWCIGAPAIPGDSGGPAIQPQPAGAVRAGGIVSGTLFTETTEEMCYSPISRVARRMNARLLSQRGG